MLYKLYGSTGLSVSALGFGGMRFENQEDVDGCAALVKACFDAGITYFDTAIGYGKSEELMGVAFKEMSRTRALRPFYVATKTFSATADDVRRDCETSLKRLQVEAIDFYHVWCVLSPEAWRERKAKGVLQAFEKLQSEGLVRHICVSSHMRGREIAEMLADYPFAGVLLGYSAMNFGFREAALDEAHQRGRAVVAMNPLGGGLIPQHPERFGFVRTRPDETVTEGALRLLFNDPRVTVALVGLSNQKQLQEALAAVNGFQPIPPERVATVRHELRASFDSLCTGCGYCDSCPQGLPVPKLMDAFNQFALSGKPESMAQRMNWHWGMLRSGHHLDDCTACGQCERACTQKLPIIARLKVVRDAVAKAVAAADAKG
ncbi:MAG: aldo/keto reductase [bacterium]